MIELFDKGAWLIGGKELIKDDEAGRKKLAGTIGAGKDTEAAKAAAAKNTMASAVLDAHNHSGNDTDLSIKFDKMTSHDITYVGIIQTARASGLERFPVPYVLTNCHNSLCAVGGTINEDDHMFGLTAAAKYGGTYVPPMLAVIHQYAREMLAECGAMILGSDSHTRYGALGTMAMGEGGPELVKQLLGRTYDIKRPGTVLIYLEGAPAPGVGPQDVALAIIGAVFENGYVKNKVMEFAGPGVANLSVDFRIGVDVMTTETTCLSSIWVTDERTEEFYEIHGRNDKYKKMEPGDIAYYDGALVIDLDKVVPMIAMPYHPSNVYTIDEVIKDPYDVMKEAEERAKVAFGDKVNVDLQSKIIDGKVMVDQGIIAGCAGGGYENICDAADILKGRSTGSYKFSLSVYPASMPVYMQLIKNGRAADLTEAGAVIKTAFCGPCFGAGDTPANNAFSIRHSTRNFPNREGSKVQNGQISSVALMDARSIAATAANQGRLTSAFDYKGTFTRPAYSFDSKIYENRVFESGGKADPDTELQLGPNIKDWPEMPALKDNLLLRVVSEIHDPVTTTDELIPSGETSSLRSNPIALSEFALSRKDPEYVGRAKEVRSARDAMAEGKDPVQCIPEIEGVLKAVNAKFGDITAENTIIGSTIFAVKPGDGSAREQAASCQRVLGGAANIANEYATKRYRSNLINWGMIPFVMGDDGASDGKLPFTVGDFIFIPGVKGAVQEPGGDIPAYVVKDGKMTEFALGIRELTDDEKQIITDGCLINYYRNGH